MSNRSLSLWRRVAALVGLGTLAVAAAVVPGADSVSAGPTNYGSVKVAVRVDGSGVPRVIQDRSVYALAVPPGTRPSAQRNAVGNYSIAVPYITARGGNVQIVPWSDGEGTPPVCTIAGWNVVDPGTVIDVLCFDAVTGAPREGTRFDLLYTHIPNGFGRQQYTYLWSSDLAPATPSTVDADYYFSGRGAATPTVQKIDRGRYVVSFSEAMARWTPIVTAYGPDPRWCNPTAVKRTGDRATSVEVVCFRPGGRPADSLFSLSMVNGNPLSGFTRNSARLRISRPTAAGLVTPGQFSVSASESPNTYRRLGAGRHKVVMPGARGQIDAGSVQAYGTLGERCFIIGLVTSRTDALQGGYRTRCIDAAGSPATPMVWVVRGDLGQLWIGSA